MVMWPPIHALDFDQEWFDPNNTLDWAREYASGAHDQNKNLNQNLDHAVELFPETNCGLVHECQHTRFLSAVASDENLVVCGIRASWDLLPVGKSDENLDRSFNKHSNMNLDQSLDSLRMLAIICFLISRLSVTGKFF